MISALVTQITSDHDPTFYVKYRNIRITSPELNEGAFVNRKTTPMQVQQHVGLPACSNMLACLPERLAAFLQCVPACLPTMLACLPACLLAVFICLPSCASHPCHSYPGAFPMTVSLAQCHLLGLHPRGLRVHSWHGG